MKMEIHTWGIVYAGEAELTMYPQGEDAPWDSRSVPVRPEERAALYAEMVALDGNRYADTPILDRLTAHE